MPHSGYKSVILSLRKAVPVGQLIPQAVLRQAVLPPSLAVLGKVQHLQEIALSSPTLYKLRGRSILPYGSSLTTHPLCGRRNTLVLRNSTPGRKAPKQQIPMRRKEEPTKDEGHLPEAARGMRTEQPPSQGGRPFLGAVRQRRQGCLGLESCPSGSDDPLGPSSSQFSERSLFHGPLWPSWPLRSLQFSIRKAHLLHLTLLP